MSKVSVVIAAYNVEKYIDQTVNSVIGQTLKDIEIIIVEDCSTDSTTEITQKLAELDSRIVLIRHDKNKSSMIARKTGVEHATGEYIMFLDGDDLLEPDACEKAYHAIWKEKVDLLQFDTHVFFEEESDGNAANEKGVRDYLCSIDRKTVSTSPCGLLDRKKTGGNINFTVWNKIYRSSVLKAANEHVPNEYLNMAEDMLLAYLVQYFSKSFSCISDRLYRYRFGSGVSTGTMVSDRKLHTLAKSVFVYTFLKKWTQDRGHEKICEEVLLQVKKQMLNNIADTFVYKAGKNQRNALIATAQQYCSVEDIVLALSSHIYSSRNISIDKFAPMCEPLDLFQSTKAEAKTIGVYYYRMYNGGVENVLSILTDMWIESGYRVVLFTDEKQTQEDYYLNPQVKRIVLPPVREPEFTAQEKRIDVFRKEIIDNHIDIMVYNAWLNQYLLLDEMIIKSCGARLIIYTHGMFGCDFASENGVVAYSNSSLSSVYRLADTIVPLNDVDVAWWKAFGHHAIKTVNPIKISFETQPSQLKGNNLLFVGRISWEKQVLDAIKILQLVKEQVPDVVLTIVGKGDEQYYVNAVEDYIKANQLEKNVKMVGFTTEVIPYYQQADVMLCTSMFEGFSLSLTESKVCGVPLVCYYLPNWDMARTPKGMINIPQGDYEAAADAVIKILQNDQLKKTMGVQARESALELYDIDLAKHWSYIFEQTLLPKPTPSEVYQLQPLEAALNIAVDRYSTGIWSRNNLPCGNIDTEQYNAHFNEFMNIINNLANSESYRLGMFLTAIPRKIKRWLKKEKK